MEPSSSLGIHNWFNSTRSGKAKFLMKCNLWDNLIGPFCQMVRESHDVIYEWQNKKIRDCCVFWSAFGWLHTQKMVEIILSGIFAYFFSFHIKHGSKTFSLNIGCQHPHHRGCQQKMSFLLNFVDFLSKKMKKIWENTGKSLSTAYRYPSLDSWSKYTTKYFY